MRVLALWSPDWPVTAAAHAVRIPPHQPAAVFVAGRVLACSAVARAQGVRRGLRRREAQARCPELAVLVPDPDRDARAFEPVVAAVEELAPGVEILRPGLLALPARGPVSWFGGELAAAERLVDQVAARAGVEIQAGFADGLFAAVLAARRAVAVAPGDTPAFLAALGVEELDREPDIDRSALVDLLRRLGLLSLGAFAALDPADVASRFGADAVLCHRLARGLDPRPPLRRRPPEELAVEAELDPPVDRVDAAAFAARGLAERLHATLAGHGLACTRLGVIARTAAGEELHRIWRCADPLTPAATVDRVRWQLDAWLTNRRDTPEEGAVVRLRLVPEETVAAGALQRGLWGETGEADERAGRALVRVQALLGPESVVTAVLDGGRDPAERIRLVPWGDDRADPPAAPEPPARRPCRCGARPDPAATGGGGTGRTGATDDGAASAVCVSGLGAGRAGEVSDGAADGGAAAAVHAGGPGDGGPGRVAAMGGGAADGGAASAVRASGPGAGRAGEVSGGASDVGAASAVHAGGPGDGGPGRVAATGGGAASAVHADGPGDGGSGRVAAIDGGVAGAAGDGGLAAPGAAGGAPCTCGARPARPGRRAAATGDAGPARRPSPTDLVPDLSDAAPAGWPVDVLRRTGRHSAVELLQQGGQPPGPRSRRRRLPVHHSPRPSPVREPPPSWPGRLPAPSPATVPPEPLPALVHDDAGEAVRLARPDLLSAPPARVAVDGKTPAAVVGWSGPWPVWARWWSPEATPSARLQVVLDDGTALLLIARAGRWWVAGIYD